MIAELTRRGLMALPFAGLIGRLFPRSLGPPRIHSAFLRFMRRPTGSVVHFRVIVDNGHIGPQLQWASYVQTVNPTVWTRIAKPELRDTRWQELLTVYFKGAPPPRVTEEMIAAARR